MTTLSEEHFSAALREMQEDFWPHLDGFMFRECILQATLQFALVEGTTTDVQRGGNFQPRRSHFGCPSSWTTSFLPHSAPLVQFDVSDEAEEEEDPSRSKRNREGIADDPAAAGYFPSSSHCCTSSSRGMPAPPPAPTAASPLRPSLSLSPLTAILEDWGALHEVLPLDMQYILKRAALGGGSKMPKGVQLNTTTTTPTTPRKSSPSSQQQLKEEEEDSPSVVVSLVPCSSAIEGHPEMISLDAALCFLGLRVAMERHPHYFFEFQEYEEEEEKKEEEHQEVGCSPIFLHEDVRKDDGENKIELEQREKISQRQRVEKNNEVSTAAKQHQQKIHQTTTSTSALIEISLEDIENILYSYHHDVY